MKFQLFFKIVPAFQRNNNYLDMQFKMTLKIDPSRYLSRQIFNGLLVTG